MRWAKTCTIILHFKFHKQNWDQITVQIWRPIKQEVWSCFTFTWQQIDLFLLWCVAMLYHLWQRQGHSVLSETIMARALVRATFTMPDVNLCTTSYNRQQNCWGTVLKYGNYSCRIRVHIPTGITLCGGGWGGKASFPFWSWQNIRKAF